MNTTRETKLFPFTSESESDLNRKLSEFRESIVNSDPSHIANIPASHIRHTDQHSYNICYAAREPDDLLKQLNRKHRATYINTSSELIFLFSGAGSQYPGMGKGIYDTEPLFKDLMDEGFEYLRKRTKIEYKDIIFPAAESDTTINSMIHTQPIVFLFGYALAKLMQSWGLKPDYMMGHSVGEYVAATISGVFHYEDAMELVLKRGELMDMVEDGSMVSVGLSEEAVTPFLSDNLSLAAVNGPDQLVISGSKQSISHFIEKMKKNGIYVAMLHTTKAAHSYMLDGILSEYRKILDDIHLSEPKIPFISNLTGLIITDEEAISKDYWVDHMRGTVQAKKGFETLLNLSSRATLMELGGGHSLVTFLRQLNESDQNVAVNMIRHPKKRLDDGHYLAESLAKVWQYGINIDWESYR